ANYSFDDDSRAAGTVPLSSLGTLAPGESALLAEIPAADFRTEWGFADSVKVLGSNATNLGRADEINLFAAPALAARLTYDDQTKFPGTIRTQGKSGIPTTGANCLALGANNVGLWQLSAVGDTLGSKASVHGDIGSPGQSPLNTCGP